ncbi:YkgJ family cysteine cluster protein, partial [Rhizobium ruizarguesonis]
GCGLCCLNKIEEWDSCDIYFTSVSCKLLDGESCLCSSYENRWDFVPDCVQLTKENVAFIDQPVAAGRRQPGDIGHVL